MEPIALIEKYRTRGVLIDTNLLLLLVIGYYNPKRISSFHRTRKYTADDFTLVSNLAATFSRVLTTPHILTEVDNLARQVSSNEHHRISAVLRLLIAKLAEVCFASNQAVESPRYAVLGLTDTVTLAVAKDVLVVTDDFSLSNILGHLGVDAININHLRNLTLFE